MKNPLSIFCALPNLVKPSRVELTEHEQAALAYYREHQLDSAQNDGDSGYGDRVVSWHQRRDEIRASSPVGRLFSCIGMTGKVGEANTEINSAIEFYNRYKDLDALAAEGNDVHLAVVQFKSNRAPAIIRSQYPIGSSIPAFHDSRTLRVEEASQPLVLQDVDFIALPEPISMRRKHLDKVVTFGSRYKDGQDLSADFNHALKMARCFSDDTIEKLLPQLAKVPPGELADSKTLLNQEAKTVTVLPPKRKYHPWQEFKAAVLRRESTEKSIAVK